DNARERGAGPHVPASLLAFELVVNLTGALPQEEQAPQEENHVPSGERVPEHAEERAREAHDGGQGEQQENARPHGQGEADGAGPSLGVGRQLSGQDRDEDDVVDAEDDLEHREGEEGDAGFGGGEPGHGANVKCPMSNTEFRNSTFDIGHWTFVVEAGGGLLSHDLAVAVPSALTGLTTVFGMGTGVALSR